MKPENERETMLCPKCKVPMVYMMEAEKNSTGRRITRYYRCPVCGTKVIVEKLLIKPVNGKLRIYDLMNGSQEIVYGRPLPAKIKKQQRRRIK